MGAAPIDCPPVAEPIEELRALAADADPPAALAPYLAKVHERASTVSDDDVAALKHAGLTEDEIFEATVSAAITEGLRRLDAARRVIG
jgi:alkylhydroperoxidase family enzyme